MKKGLLIFLSVTILLTGLIPAVTAQDNSKASSVELNYQDTLEIGSYSLELADIYTSDSSTSFEDTMFFEVTENNDDNPTAFQIGPDETLHTVDDRFDIEYNWASQDEQKGSIDLLIPFDEQSYSDKRKEGDDWIENGFRFEIVGFEPGGSDDQNPYNTTDDKVEIEVKKVDGNVIDTKLVEVGTTEEYSNNQFNPLVEISVGEKAINDDEPNSDTDDPYVDDLTVRYPSYSVTGYNIVGSGSNSDSDSDSNQDTVEKTQIVNSYLMFPDETLTIEGDNTYTITTTDPGLGADQVYLQVSKNGEVIDDSINLQEYGSRKTINDGVIDLALGAINAERGGYNINVFAPSQYSPQFPSRESNVLMEPTLDSHEAIIGQPVQVRVGNIENTGTGDAYNLKITGPVPNGFNLEGNNVMGPVNLGSGNTHSDHTYFLIPNSAGEYELGAVEASWSDDVESKSRTYSFQNPTLTVYGEPTINAEAQMIVDGQEIDVPSVLPGDEVTLSLNLENVGGGPATEIGVSLNGKSRILDSINAGESEEVSFNYTAGEPGLKSIEANIGYKDAVGDSSYSLDKSISLIVEEPPKPDLEISSAFKEAGSNRTVDRLKVGDPYVYEVKITNNGEAQAENVVTRFNNLTKVVGTIEVNSTETATYQYVPETEGNYNMTTDVYYEIEHSYGEGPNVLNSTNSLNVSNPPIDLDPRNLAIVLLFALAIISAAYYYKKSSELKKDESRREDMTKEGGLPDHKKRRE